MMQASARVLGVLLAVAVAGSTLVLCAWTLVVMIFGVDTGYNEPTTAAGWMYAVDGATRALLHTSAAVAIALLTTCLIAMAGAVLRRPATAILGSVCGALLVLALVGVVVAGHQVEALAARAIAAVGSTPAIAVPPPPPSVDDQHTVAEAREEMLRMLSASVAAAAEPVTNEGGAEPSIDDSLLGSVACGDTGARVVASVTLKTGENAASLRSILSVWDAAGYLPDRATQEDLRYSTTLPIERMSIRDTTTIDGFLHLSVESACAVG